MSSDVRRRIAEGNPWYVDEQRSAQLGTDGGRWALEGRWRLFDRVIERWLAAGRPVPRTLRVLDAGCGDGINMTVLRDLLAVRGFGCTLIGSDYNALRLARAPSGQGSLLLQADLRAMPFPDAAFDMILCSHVLEHIPEDGEALRELARMLAPGGLLIVAVPNEGCLLAWLRNHVVQPAILRTTDHVQFYTAATLMARAEAAGLSPLGTIEREGVFVPHLGIYTRVRETRLGRRLLALLARMLPSQAAGLVAGFQKH